MNITYVLPVPIAGFEKNYKAGQNLLTMMEISGVFSTAFLDKVYKIISRALYHLEKNEIKEAEDYQNEFFLLLTTYSIFSKRFREMCEDKFKDTISR